MSKQSRLTIKGQVTIPKDVRDALGLRPGDLVTFDETDGAVTVRKGKEAEPESFEDRLERARALANPLPLGMTTDEYMALIREPLPPYDE
jgi:AbrB family looped-hinge helix DNA binding protein